MQDNSPQILIQSKAYRRGLVLGLTMAEIMVLVLFALLLILTSTYGGLQKELRSQRERLEGFAALEDRMSDLVRDNPKGVTVTDIIQEIKRQQDTVESLNAKIADLKANERNAEALETVIREITREKGQRPTPQQIANKLEEAANLISVIKDISPEGEEMPTPSPIANRLATVAQLIKENETVRGQNIQLGRQLKASGKGNEFPSCWVTADGKPESIYKLMISETGITVIDRDLPHRSNDKEQLPILSVPYNISLPSYEFKQYLEPLYHWSIAHNCRFYVILSSSELSAPIHLVNLANGFFYPDSKSQYRPARIGL